jgi:hypothetical protein
MREISQMDPRTDVAEISASIPDGPHSPTSPLWFTAVRMLLAIALGVVVPLMLMLQAHTAIQNLDEHLGVSGQLADLGKSLPAPVLKFSSGNDYALYSLAMIEASNFRGLLNKQRMKVAVIHIGFAIASVGVLFIVLGFDRGGLEFSGGVDAKTTLNLKVAGSGLAVFVLGAGLAGAGGLMPNQYTTAGMPQYVATLGEPPLSPAAASPLPFKTLTSEQVRHCLEGMADEASMNQCLVVRMKP